MNSFKRLLSYARPFSQFWPGFLVLSILSVIFGVVNYALLGPLLTVLFEPSDIEQLSVMPEFAFNAEYFQNLFRYYLTSIMTASRSARTLLIFFILTFPPFFNLYLSLAFPLKTVLLTG